MRVDSSVSEESGNETRSLDPHDGDETPRYHFQIYQNKDVFIFVKTETRAPLKQDSIFPLKFVIVVARDS